MCSSRKYPCPPQGRLSEFTKWRGVSKTQFFERKYDTKMEFLEGWGFNLKNLPWEGYGYFLEQHNMCCLINHVYMHSFRNIIEATEVFPGVGTFEQLFDPVRREFEQKFSKDSNAGGGGVVRGGDV